MTKLRRYLVFSPKLDEHSLPKVTVFSGVSERSLQNLTYNIVKKKKNHN